MKVVVTGSTGLIGRALMKRLRQAGHEAVTLSRPAWNGERDVPPLNVLRGCDVVMHLAGENVASERWTSSRKKQLIDSRILSAKNLKAGLEEAGVCPKLFLSASGVGYFGSRGDEELHENSNHGRDFLAELCLAWEAAANFVKADRVVQARFGVVLSPEGGFLEKVIPMFNRFGASRLGDGKHWVSWIQIEDAVEFLMQTMIQNHWQGPFNVVAPHAVTNAQLTQELKLQLRTFRGLAAPAFALKILYGELAQALLGSQRAIPSKLEKYGFKWKYPTLQAALAHSLNRVS